ncbi:MAG: LysE family translocator [Dermatophilaceae bacterium]
MDLVTSLPAFLLAVVVISATPGPVFALVVRRTALRGLSYGLATVVGSGLGLYAWALLVASGVAVVAASGAGYLVLKAVGCSVLGYLAVRSWLSWWRQRRAPGEFDAGDAVSRPRFAAAPRGRWWAAGEGFVIQMANPKAALFLLALYPQFVPDGQPLFRATAVLGLLQVAVETLLYALLALGVARASTWFRRSVVRRRLEALTGSVLVVLGARLAVSDRPV